MSIVLVPLAIALLALLVTGAFKDFIQDALVFNQTYYSKYALTSDPLTIAKVVLRSNYAYARLNIQPLAWQTVDGFALLANAIAFIVLVRQRRLALAVALALVAAASRGRGVTFHDQTYYLLSYFSVALVTVAVVRSFGISTGSRVLRTLTIAGGLGFLLFALNFYVVLTRAFPWSYSDPPRYGYQDVISATTDPGDEVWMLPLGFSGYLQSHRMPASRYAFYLPWPADSSVINDTIMQDLARSQPPVIIIPPHVSIFFYKGDGVVLPLDLDVYGEPLRERLAADYTPAGSSDERLQGVLLRRDRAEELRQRLRTNGLVPDDAG